MESGKISNDFRCLSDQVKVGVLSTYDKLSTSRSSKKNYLCSQRVDPKYVVTNLKNCDLPFHPSIFEKINGCEIKRGTMKTNGSHGSSGFDADEWRGLLTSYKSSSIILCTTVSKLAIRIATVELHFLKSYNACRLIALDKCPGTQPI